MAIESKTAAVFEKYEAERAKRADVVNFTKGASTRSEGLADLAKDPWVDYDALAREQPALCDGGDIKFLILGAGHNGIIFAAELIKAGFSRESIVVVDEAGGFGGTWYWNRYPGLTCDVEGYSYLPLLEDTGFVPKFRYSKGEEIRENAERIVKHFGIRGMFCTKLISADWDDVQKRWAIRLRRDLGPKHTNLNGDLVVRAQFFMPVSGGLNVPSAPNLQGLDEFRRNRKLFHSARWDYDYTGGSQLNPDLVNLRDKVVGIIGTGATGVQVAPELAKWAKHVYVFQRTPSYVGPRTQVETTPEMWAKIATGPGWQRARRDVLDRCLSDDPDLTETDDVIDDGWSHARSFAGLIGSPRARAQDLSPEKIPEHIQAMLDRDLSFAEELRAHVREVVRDQVTAEKLCAYFPGWCKRPTFHQWYLQCFNQPNVTLVDTEGKGVEAYTSKGVIVGSAADAKEYELDALVLATGFDQSEGRVLTSSGAAIRGRGGKLLESDARIYLGVAADGFPNMFVCSTASGGSASANVTSSHMTSARLIAHVLRSAAGASQDAGRLVVESDPEATARYSAVIIEKQSWFAGVGVCPPTYFTRYMDPKNIKNQIGVWPYGPADFARHIDEYVQSGETKGFRIAT